MAGNGITASPSLVEPTATPSVAGLMPAIGQRVLYGTGNGLQFECSIVDAKSSYGRTRVRLEPVAGSGTAWVDLSSVRKVRA